MPPAPLLNAANAITLLRFVLIPVIGQRLAAHDYDTAFGLFIVSALSDLADGAIARHWQLRTRLGAIADPLADKLTMLTVTVALAFQGWLPWAFAAAVIGRDLLIVGGAAAYHLWIGPVPIAPSRLSKFNTALEFVLLTSVLAVAAGALPDGPWREALLLCTLGTVLWSGADYVWVWSGKAIAARRARREAVPPRDGAR